LLEAVRISGQLHDRCFSFLAWMQWIAGTSFKNTGRHVGELAKDSWFC
jgi:hypothetical protein